MPDTANEAMLKLHRFLSHTANAKTLNQARIRAHLALAYLDHVGIENAGAETIFRVAAIMEGKDARSSNYND